MNKETGRFRQLAPDEAPTSDEIGFDKGEIIEIKGHPFRVQKAENRVLKLKSLTGAQADEYRAAKAEEAGAGG